MEYRAKNPQGVFDKFDECKFFLGLMSDYTQKVDIQGRERLPAKLLYCLSAFLFSFRSTAYRLIGVVRNRNGADAGRKLRDQLLAHPDIGFLKDIPDQEMHGDGAVIWPRYKMDIPESFPDRWPSRYVDRSRTRFESRWSKSGVTVQVVDWRFARRPENLVEHCDRALVELGKCIDSAQIQNSSSARTQATVGVFGA